MHADNGRSRCGAQQGAQQLFRNLFMWSRNRVIMDLSRFFLHLNPNIRIGTTVHFTLYLQCCTYNPWCSHKAPHSRSTLHSIRIFTPFFRGLELRRSFRGKNAKVYRTPRFSSASRNLDGTCEQLLIQLVVRGRRRLLLPSAVSIDC